MQTRVLSQNHRFIHISHIHTYITSTPHHTCVYTRYIGMMGRLDHSMKPIYSHVEIMLIKTWNMAKGLVKNWGVLSKVTSTSKEGNLYLFQCRRRIG